MTEAPRPRQNPKVLTLRLRAYRHCLAHGTDFTIADLAQALDTPTAILRRALRDEKWATVLRSGTLDMPVRPEFQGADAFEAQQAAAGFLRMAG